MIEAPAIEVNYLRGRLRDEYGIGATAIIFLPLGYDPQAAVYHVETIDGTDYFLKLQLAAACHVASHLATRLLAEVGIQHVVAPILTNQQQAVADAQAYRMILFPFVDGTTGMEAGLSTALWRELGAVLAVIHAFELPADMAAAMPKESFQPVWLPLVAALQRWIESGEQGDLMAEQLRQFWLEKQALIDEVVGETGRLSTNLRAQKHSFVLCHADIHTANIIVGENGRLHIIDWGGAMLAPKERDLMFFDRHNSPFFESYGGEEASQQILTYYHFEWVIQEIGEYGDLICFRQNAGEATRQLALAEFCKLFEKDNVVERAFRNLTDG